MTNLKSLFSCWLCDKEAPDGGCCFCYEFDSYYCTKHITKISPKYIACPVCISEGIRSPCIKEKVSSTNIDWGVQQ